MSAMIEYSAASPWRIRLCSPWTSTGTDDPHCPVMPIACSCAGSAPAASMPATSVGWAPVGAFTVKVAVRRPRNALTKQYKKLLDLDGVQLKFTEG